MIIEKSPPFRDGMPPIHPGELIAEDLEEWGMSAAEFDAALAVPSGTVAAAERACSKLVEPDIRKICTPHVAIAWKRCPATAPVSTAY